MSWIFACAAISISSTLTLAETLSQAIGSALRNSPEIQALAADVKASGYGIRAAKGSLGPTVTTSAELTGSTRDSSDGWSASVSATQNIYDGGYSRNELNRTKAIHSATINRLREQTSIGSLAAIRVYMEVQRSRGIVRILQSNLSSLKTLQHRVRLRVEAGVSNEVELFDTASKLDAAKISLIDAQSQLADAVAEYQIVIGHLPGPLETTNVPFQLLPSSQKETVRLAQGYSPRVMALRYEASAADAVTQSSAAANRPKVDLSLSASHNDLFDKRYRDSDQLSAQIALRFDLYDGGSSTARVRQSNYNAIAAHARARTESNDLKLEVAKALNAVDIADQKVAILKSQLSNTRRTFTLSRKRYDAGVTPLAEILDLHTAVTTAEAAWLNAEFAHRYNVYRVLASIGRIPSPPPGMNPVKNSMKVASAQ